MFVEIADGDISKWCDVQLHKNNVYLIYSWYGKIGDDCKANWKFGNGGLTFN